MFCESVFLVVNPQRIFLFFAYILYEGYLIDFFGRKEIRDMFAEIFSYDQELIDKGIEQGIEIQTMEMARKLIAKNMSVKDISEITGLSKTDIEELMK